MNKNIYISARDIAENAKLNHEISEELRRCKINLQPSSSGLTRGSRWLRKPCLTWIPVSGTGMTKIVCLTFFSILPNLTQAETCTATPDCKSLGYTQTSCPDGGGVKCPWNKALLYCGENGKKICTDMGHPYTCTGANEIPSGKACANKYYTTCTCASGYEWKNGKCEKVIIKTCAIGDVLYADKKCYVNPPSLPPIGVVFSSGKAVALKDISSSMTWSGGEALCNNYSESDVNGWLLPSKDELLAIYSNKSAVSSGLTIAGGSQFTSDWYWSSTYIYINGYNCYYIVDPVNGTGTSCWNDSNYGYVRPVLAF